MKKVSLTILTMIILCSHVFANDVMDKESAYYDGEQLTTEEENPEWLGAVLEQIQLDEYAIQWHMNKHAYTSPNRNQGFRAYYYTDGFELMPRTLEEEAWSIRMGLHSIEQNAQCIVASQEAKSYVDGGKLTFDFGTYEIEYENDVRGMRQNFIIHENLLANNEQEIRVNLTIGGNLKVAEQGNTGIAFVQNMDNCEETIMTYEDLKVWDATGRLLQSRMNLAGETLLQLIVDATDAVYPITIDPLSSSADWTGESNQTFAEFGYSVSSAGDVNGDGYSDVLVGAWKYDNGESDEGQVFLFEGSENGLATSASWTAEGNQGSANFGVSVANAGDINGDGYGDVVIGAYLYTNAEFFEGATYVYHGSSTGLSATADWSFESDVINGSLGYSVSTAGDVNGDGYSDIIIGAPYLTNGEGAEGRAYVFHGSASGLGGSADWTVESNQNVAFFGWDVACAGDVNGDGYSDVIVGSYAYDNGEANEGAAFVYHGSASGLGTTAAWSVESDQGGALLGYSVSGLGDVNGDGYGDVIIGSKDYDNGETNEGQALVYHGSASGLNSTAAWTFELNQADAGLGNAVSAAGDVNGDGYADALVGAHLYDNGATDEGYVGLFLGGENGLSTTVDWSIESDQASAELGIAVSSAGDVNGDGLSDILVSGHKYDNGEMDEGVVWSFYGVTEGVDTEANWSAEGNQANAWMGWGLASAGDVNGDGYNDALVGARYYDNGETDEGAAFLYYGSEDGLETTAAWSTELNQAAVEFGWQLAGAGDVNGDGYSDVIIGAYLYDNGETDEGAAFVYYGSATGFSSVADWSFESDQAYAFLGRSVASAGDVNGDGYSDVLVGANGYTDDQMNEGRVYLFLGSATGLETTAAWVGDGNQVDSEYGMTVASAGDVNGDAFSDVIIGARFYDNGETNEGRAYVYYGSASGLSGTPDWEVESNQTNAQFGVCVTAAGDVNGDGYGDVAVGAWRYDGGQTDEGAVFVYHGSSAGLSTSADWQAESDQGSALFGHGIANAGDVNGDGFGDLIVGAHFYDGAFTNSGGAWLYMGSDAGLESSADWMESADQASTRYGAIVAGGGDVNGDGYSDIMVGSPNYSNGSTSEGAAFVYYGNGADNRLARTAQYQPGTSNRIEAGGLTGTDQEVRLSLSTSSFFGKQDGKLVWEYQPNGSSFSSSSVASTGESAGYTDLGTTSIELAEDLTGIGTGADYKWRVRVKYDPVTSFTGQVYGPWKYYTNQNPEVSGLGFKAQNSPLVRISGNDTDDINGVAGTTLPSYQSNTVDELHKGGSMNLYPNPVYMSDVVTVSLEVEEEDSGSIWVKDFNGYTLYTASIQLLKGRNAIQLSAEHFPEGSYMVVLQTKHIKKMRMLNVYR